jgi:hypothetical protein
VANLEEWRERLRQAQQQYMQASASAAKIQEEYAAQRPQTADGEYALQHALRAESLAREAYMKVLKVFTRMLEETSPE